MAKTNQEYLDAVRTELNKVRGLLELEGVFEAAAAADAQIAAVHSRVGQLEAELSGMQEKVEAQRRALQQANDHERLRLSETLGLLRRSCEVQRDELARLESASQEATKRHAAQIAALEAQREGLTADIDALRETRRQEQRHLDEIRQTLHRLKSGLPEA